MHKQLSMRFVVAPLKLMVVCARTGERVARGYYGGVLLYLTTLMELVSVARGNTLTSPIRTPDHQATPRLTRDEMGWERCEKRRNIMSGACVVHSLFAIASCVRDSWQG